MIRPEHDFTLSRDNWERVVFENSTNFSVVVYHQGTKWRADFTDFQKAVETAGEASTKHKPILYAVTDSGRSVVVPPDRWDEYLRFWRAKHMACGGDPDNCKAPAFECVCAYRK